MRIRQVPFLGTDTPMYDLLRLFQVRCCWALSLSHLAYLEHMARLSSCMGSIVCRLSCGA